MKRRVGEAQELSEDAIERDLANGGDHKTSYNAAKVVVHKYVKHCESFDKELAQPAANNLECV